MITGFNTDIEHNNVVYHVQTEDKGLETPLILSLVYTRGEILAAKRAPYDDLIQSGFDEKILTERLQRQHRLICAAIKQGRIEDLKRMNARDAEQKGESEKARTVSSVPLANETESFELPETILLSQLSIAVDEPFDDEADLSAPVIANSNHQLGRILQAKEGEQVADFVRAEAAPANALNLMLLNERDLRGGEDVTLQIHVSQGDRANEKDVANARLTIKVLGAAFQPIIFNAQTSEHGLAVVKLRLPSFKIGRAALLIRASFDQYEAELRRIVLQGEVKTHENYR